METVNKTVTFSNPALLPGYNLLMRKKYLLYIAILLMGAGLRVISQYDLALPGQDQRPSAVKDQTPYRVTYVIDGDTIKIDKDGHEETLRLLGINTPEVESPYRTPECWGQEASTETKAKLLGQSIHIESDPSQSLRDKYNRLLVYVFLANGTNFNQQLIEEGFAREYTYAGAYTYRKDFKAAEAKARAESRGLWSIDNCPEK
jgi:micrococcal nuclease